MDTSLISECVLEALSSNMTERQLRMCMKQAGASTYEIDQAVREFNMAQSWTGQERLA